MMTDLERMNMVELAGLVYDQVEYATGKHKSRAAEKAALIAAAEEAETLAKALRNCAGQKTETGACVSAGKQ